MLINHEVPVRNLQQATFNDYGYALAHNFNDGGYREYFRELSKIQPVYLDNSAFELGQSVPADYLAWCVSELEHRCRVFLPDVVGNAEETVKLSREFAKHVRCPVWGVIQGRDIVEQTWCFREMLKITDNIALPYRTVNRLEFLEVNDRLINKYYVQIHLLGVRDMRELLSVKNNPSVVSVDTSLPVVLGCKGVELTLDSEKDPTPVWDIEVETLPELVYNNAEFFRKVVNE